MSKVAFHYGEQRLENDLVALEPFDVCLTLSKIRSIRKKPRRSTKLTLILILQPSVHVAHFLEVIKSNPALFEYAPSPKVDTEADFMRDFYDKISTSPNECLLAVLDKTVSPGKQNNHSNYAGIASLTATNPLHAATDIGVIIFPSFQRTHIAKNTIGLLLLWTLDPPSTGGLGLRRVEWQTHTENQASRRIASRMGFEFEGIARWHRKLPGNNKVGLPVDELERQNGTKGEVRGRHTAIYSIVWDEWVAKRPQVVALMEQKR
jgi:RimJ/RimL family protein N-acetyltransferase